MTTRMTTTRSPRREPRKHGYSFREGLTMMAANGCGIDPYLAAEAGEDAKLSLRALRHALTLPQGPERREALATAARELRNIDPGRHGELVTAIAAKITEAEGRGRGPRTNPATGQQEFAIEEITVTGTRPPAPGAGRTGNSFFLRSAGPELGFLTGGFHLDLPGSIANLARLSGVDIKIDENGDWTYQGRKIDDIAAEQGKTKTQVLTEIFQTEVIPALPPGAGAPRSSGVLPPLITAGGGKFTGTVNVDVRSQVTDEQREAFKDTISNMTDNAFSDQELDIIIDSMLKDLGFFEAGWNGFLSIDPYANPLQLTDGQGRIIHRLISRIPGELSSRVQHQLRIAIESGRVVCATCLGPNT